MSETSTAAQVPALPSAWIEYITPFAKALGKDVADVSRALMSVAGDPGDQAIEILRDASAAPDADIKSAFPGVPSGVMNKAVKLLRGATQASQAATAFALGGGLAMLPEVPTTDTWLNALRTGGQLKVDQPTVISVVRAALAHRIGFYDIPERLVQKMEAHQEALSEPASMTYYELREDLVKRNYAEIFAAIPGISGQFVTETRKKQLFSRIDSLFWPALFEFQGQLKGWIESWQQGAANPAVVMNALTAFLSGGGASMAPTMMQSPDTGGLRDAAEAFCDTVNKVFAGTGIPIARALAYDAKRIRDQLENQLLPAAIGAPNREHMLKMLGVDVTAQYPRLETNITRYVLSVMQVKDLPAGNEELQFMVSLYMLGSQIQWNELEVGRGSYRNRQNVESDRVTAIRRGNA